MVTKKTKEVTVVQWRKELKTFDAEKSAIAEQLRTMVFKMYPKTSERIIYGGIMFTYGEDFGGIFVSKNHVSFEFSKGYTFKDPKKLLEGTGKYRRHLKIKSVADIENKEVSSFVAQVA